MEPPEQGQNYSVNIPLTTDVSSDPNCESRFLNSTFRCNMLVQQSTSPTQSSTRHPPLLQHLRKRWTSWSSGSQPGDSRRTRRRRPGQTGSRTRAVESKNTKNVEKNTKIQMKTKPKGSRTKARESSTRGLPATGSVPGWRTWTSPSSRLVQQPSMTILQPWLNLAFCRFSWWTVPRSCGSDSPSSSLLAKDSPRLSRSGWPSSTSSTWSTCSGSEVF